MSDLAQQVTDASARMKEIAAKVSVIESAIDRANAEVFAEPSRTADALKAERQSALVDEALGQGIRKDFAKLEAAIAKAEQADAALNAETNAAKKRNAEQQAGLVARLKATQAELLQIEADRHALILSLIKQMTTEAAKAYGGYAVAAIEAFSRLAALDLLHLELTGYKNQTGVLPNVNQSIKLPAALGLKPIASKRHLVDGYLIDSFKNMLLLDGHAADIRSELEALLNG